MFAPKMTRSHRRRRPTGVRRGPVLAYTTSPGEVKCKSRARPARGTAASYPLPYRGRSTPLGFQGVNEGHRRHAPTCLRDRNRRFGKLDRWAQIPYQTAQPVEIRDDDHLAVDQDKALLAQPPQRPVDMHQSEAEMVGD